MSSLPNANDCETSLLVLQVVSEVVSECRAVPWFTIGLVTTFKLLLPGSCWQERRDKEEDEII